MPKGNRSAVLGLRTIWCIDWIVEARWGGTRWPDKDELEYEGSQRIATNRLYGRELPLVRAWRQGDKTITYDCASRLPEFELDAVRRVPTYEDIYYPVDKIDDVQGHQLLNRDIWTAMQIKDPFLSENEI